MAYGSLDFVVFSIVGNRQKRINLLLRDDYRLVSRLAGEPVVYILSAYTEKLSGRFARLKSGLYEHLSLSGRIELSDIREYLTDEQYRRLRNIFPDGRIVFWGTSRRIGSRIKEGDIVAIYTDYCVYLGVVAYVINNERLALGVWGQISRNKTWNHVFFLTNVVKLDHEDFNRIIGRDPSWMPRRWYFACLRGMERDKVLNYMQECME